MPTAPADTASKHEEVETPHKEADTTQETRGGALILLVMEEPDFASAAEAAAEATDPEGRGEVTADAPAPQEERADPPLLRRRADHPDVHPEGKFTDSVGLNQTLDELVRPATRPIVHGSTRRSVGLLHHSAVHEVAGEGCSRFCVSIAATSAPWSMTP